MIETISNAGSTQPKLFVGVRDFKMLLKNSCHLLGQCENEIVLSFELEGEFLPAAIADAIDQTVNYAALCQFCQETLSEAPCHKLPTAASLGSALRQFSPYIQGGHLRLEGRSHDVFFNDYCLL